MHNAYLIMIFAHIQVIKKVMKMDAAEPFNVPVNPVALGIPVSMNCCLNANWVKFCNCISLCCCCHTTLQIFLLSLYS